MSIPALAEGPGIIDAPSSCDEFYFQIFGGEISDFVVALGMRTRDDECVMSVGGVGGEWKKYHVEECSLDCSLESSLESSLFG